MIAIAIGTTNQASAVSAIAVAAIAALSSRGGLPQWPAKALLMIGFTLLLIQGISELIKRIAVMRGLIPDPYEAQPSSLEAEVEHLVEAIKKD